MIPDPTNPFFMKLAKKVFRYDHGLSVLGWTHDVYYNVTLNTYIIADFPDKNSAFELKTLPSDGLCELTVKDQTYIVKFYE